MMGLYALASLLLLLVTLSRGAWLGIGVGLVVLVMLVLPRLKPAQVPFVSDSDAVVQSLEVDGETVYITAVSLGNPHAVQVVADVDAAPVGTQGAALERHPRFPHRVNAGFLQVMDQNHIRLRVFERGAGETLACGTGACAAAVAGILRNLIVSPVRVTTRGGDLRVSWDGPGRPVMMTGPAVNVFEGEIEP
jgi:diaminopimelate epimerase